MTNQRIRGAFCADDEHANVMNDVTWKKTRRSVAMPVYRVTWQRGKSDSVSLRFEA